MTQSIQLNLNRLCEKMRQAGYEEFKINWVTEIVNELQQIDVQGLDTFVRKLSGRLAKEDEYRDILKEGRFARILAGSGFKQIEIEYAKKGADVKACYNKRTVYFEIRRIRENEDDKEIRRSKDGVGWISAYRIDNLLSIIQDKIKQLKNDELNILVLWSDTGSLGKHEFDEAVQEIQQEIDTAPEAYRKLSGVLFTSGVSYNYGIPKEFHLFSNDKANTRLPNRLANKLQSITEEDPRKLQKDYEDLVAAMKKHSH